MNRLIKIQFPMTVTKRLFLTLLLSVSFVSISHLIHAQEGAALPKNMLEVGIHGGYLFVAGDVAQNPGYAGGIHIRKATDYMFSLRLDALAGKASGTSKGGSRDFDMTYFSGALLGVFSFNSFRFDKNVKKTNYYALIGGGADYFTTTFANEENRGTLDYDIAPHMTAGAGVSFRLSPKVNIGIEHQASLLFGKRADLLDGSELEDGVRTPFRDVLNYTSIRINFNLGNPSSHSEPLYWINPLDKVFDDIASVKKRQDEILLDTDSDGIIDALDQEPDTPAGATVDTKGRTLDSDKDGVPDYKDLEPYFPPRAGEVVNEEGVVTNPNSSRGGVSEDKVQDMIDQAFEQRGISTGGGTSGGSNTGGGSVAEWFLPMIHFGTDSKNIKYSDYGTLASIGQMMKGNPNVRLVVTGYTDQTGKESYNEALSYERAKAVIDHLVSKQGIGRGRLILQWGGKTAAIVPMTASYMNRRVQFRTATNADVEMDPPAGGSSGY